MIHALLKLSREIEFSFNTKLMINSFPSNNDITEIYLGTREDACNPLSYNLTMLLTCTETLWMKLNFDEISIDEDSMPVLNKHG